MKKYAPIIVIILILGGFIYLTSRPEKQKSDIVVTFYPVYNFTKNVTKEFNEVSQIVPGGVEPHEYEPGAQEIIQAESSSLLIYNGAGLDPWAEKISAGKAASLAIVDELSEDLIISDGITDPHFWLDPILAAKQVQVISEVLTEVYPEHSKHYTENAKKYISELSDLDKEYAIGLNHCKSRELVVTHNAFSYLANRYGLEIRSLAGLTPEDEPSAKELKDMVDFVKENKIKYVFTESLVSPKLAEALSLETGAKLFSLNPIEGLTEEEKNNGEDYLSLMRKNLAAIRQALNCE